MTLFSLLNGKTVHLSKGKKVLKQEEYAELVEIQELKDKVNKELDEMKIEAEKECVELKKAAEDKGYQEALVRLNEHILYFDSQIKAIRLELMQKILPLALTAAKKIVSAELKQHPEAIVDIVIKVLQSALQNRKITVFVNKDDKEILEAHKNRLKEPFERLESLSIQESPDVTPGGCIIETETGIINASLDNQWRALESAFARYSQEKS